MVAIDFPDAPTTGQVFDKWTWNGSVWALTAAPVALIAQIRVATAQPSLDFQSIPATYTHLRLVASLRSTVAAAQDTAAIRFNNVSTASYAYQGILSYATTVSAAESFSASSITAGVIAGNTAPFGSFSTRIIDIPDYRSTNLHNAQISSGGYSAGSTGGIFLQQIWGVGDAGGAITRVSLFLTSANFAVGSVASLYGEP